MAARNVVVTGASRGLGRSLAVALAAGGDHVVGTGRHAAELERTAAACDDLPGSFSGRLLDVCDAVAVQRLIDGLDEIDVCIANAGVADERSFLETSVEDLRRTLEVNTIGAFAVMRAAAARMVEAGHGRIVPIASVFSYRGRVGKADYVASKHALLGLARSLVLELEGTGVYVTTICPGWMRTGIEGERSLAGGMDPDEAAAAIVAAIGVGPSIGHCEFLFQAHYLL